MTSGYSISKNPESCFLQQNVSDGGIQNHLSCLRRKIAANVAHLLALLGEQQVMVYMALLWSLDSEKLNLQIQVVLIY